MVIFFYFRDLGNDIFGLWIFGCKAINKFSKCVERKFAGDEFPDETILFPFLHDTKLPELVSNGF